MSYMICPKCGEANGMVNTTIFQCRCARTKAEPSAPSEGQKIKKEEICGAESNVNAASGTSFATGQTNAEVAANSSELAASGQAWAGPRCPHCKSPMEDAMKRFSANSTSAVRVFCEGKDLSHHQFQIYKLSDFAQFFPAAPAAQPGVEILETLKGIASTKLDPDNPFMLMQAFRRMKKQAEAAVKACEAALSAPKGPAGQPREGMCDWANEVEKKSRTYRHGIPAEIVREIHQAMAPAPAPLDLEKRSQFKLGLQAALAVIKGGKNIAAISKLIRELESARHLGSGGAKG